MASPSLNREAESPKPEKVKRPYKAAMDVAESLVAELGKHCERIQIAGSLRRGKAQVGDIEILYIPFWDVRAKPGEFFEKEPYALTDRVFQWWLDSGLITKRLSKDGVPAWGAQNKLGVHARTGIPVDFFGTTLSNWWMSLVIRTGSKETNIRLATGAKRLGRHLHPYGSGVSEHGTMITATSEEHVFALCGVAYLPPHKR